MWNTYDLRNTGYLKTVLASKLKPNIYMALSLSFLAKKNNKTKNIQVRKIIPTKIYFQLSSNRSVLIIHFFQFF